MIDIWWRPVQVHPSESKTRARGFHIPSCDYCKVSDYCFMILLLSLFDRDCLLRFCDCLLRIFPVYFIIFESEKFYIFPFFL